MSDKPELGLILRRLKVERAKGSSIEQMYDVIMEMIRCQRAVEAGGLVEKNLDVAQLELLKARHDRVMEKSFTE